MVYGQIILETSRNGIEITGHDGTFYNTNASFKGVPVKINVPNDAQDAYLQRCVEKLNEDFPIFKKNFDQYIKNDFAELLPKASDWGMNVNSVAQLMQMGKLSSIIYSVWNSGYGSFQCFFNDGKYKTDKFFQGHSFSVEYSVQNGKFHRSEKGQLEG